jgi:hypothetical protein
MVPEYKDTFREDIVKTYSEWLRLEGKFDDIGNILSLFNLSINLTVLPIPIITYALLLAEAYEQNPTTQSSEASNPTPPTQWPAHARRIKTGSW